jgi:hypothetical protein
VQNAVQSAVVLITTSEQGWRESGSGFVIYQDEEFSYALTAAHVIRPFKANTIQVNGTKAVLLESPNGKDVDLAVLKCPRLPGVQALAINEFVAPKRAVYGFAFQHLYGEDYFRSEFRGKVSALLTIQGKSSSKSLQAWEIAALAQFRILPGNSGAPLLETGSDRVVGIITHAFNEGLKGIALSPGAIRYVWPDFPGFAEIKDMDDRPPDPGPITRVDDIQKKRFGGQPTRSGRQLTVEVTQKFANYFFFDAVVRSTDDSKLQGPARFFLHDTYPRPQIWIRKVDCGVLALRDIYSYGVYTIGCQVKDKYGNWISLEYDLADLVKRRKLPKVFLR